MTSNITSTEKWPYILWGMPVAGGQFVYDGNLVSRPKTIANNFPSLCIQRAFLHFPFSSFCNIKEKLENSKYLGHKKFCVVHCGEHRAGRVNGSVAILP